MILSFAGSTLLCERDGIVLWSCKT